MPKQQNETGWDTASGQQSWADGVSADEPEAMAPSTLVRVSKPKCYAPREVIYHEGDPADTVFVIGSGLVKLLSYLPNGRARIVRLHGSGAWIGLGGLLHRPHEHTAVAVDEVRVYRIATNRLSALKQDDPRQYCQLLEQWHEHLREADLWISQFSTGPIKTRLACLIRFLSSFEYGDSSRMVELLTCEDMAAVLGVTPESVSRIIASFKRDHVLDLLQEHPTELYRLDEGALRQMTQQ
jgi:CRP/FNR family transcriptional regulator